MNNYAKNAWNEQAQRYMTHECNDLHKVKYFWKT